MRLVWLSVTLLALSSPSLLAQGGASAPRVAACPYTAAEVSTALGFEVKDGAPGRESSFGGGRTTSCRYEAKRPASPLFTVNLVIMDDANSKDTTFLKFAAGKMVPISGDTDGAMWQTDQGDVTNATLWYLRRGVTVEARVWVNPRDPTFDDVRARLAKLRRIP